MTDEERDCALRALNNAALAKHYLLHNGGEEVVLRHLNAALSWAYPLFGVDHPMFEADRSSQYAPLLHEDMKHQGQSS